jgi:hypothetical protein
LIYHPTHLYSGCGLCSFACKKVKLILKKGGAYFSAGIKRDVWMPGNVAQASGKLYKHKEGLILISS